ncbi:hypothetical protein ACIBWG_18000 [Streptomyces griseoaurantiacus]|uniref:Uncharacterized protein n=1 Tax=Streptomyces griseoaurantiacus TaxID=68213 RepID=A0ABZ1V170_9ACTN|nr:MULTISPECIES: hypothetical protein [Streptomyces]MCF0089314.1 hypothetical protein [Streptomyces sp. MH192]MCF0101351.1 hypothetical protein [Streptomyces sp. MH191]MDX3089781.1 hypothetical protein [Streptomyces sp. ME12-02E]MDX3333247.1 hypothetical protein [Streptomyces sp. ME02-6978a]
MSGDSGGRDGLFFDGSGAGRTGGTAAGAGAPRERVPGRVWTVRLDPFGGPSSGAVRLSCSSPGCGEQRLPGAPEGRKAAVAHVNVHLAGIRAGGGPRGEAWCGCRAADCAWHSPEILTGRRAGTRQVSGTGRCGGSVVLTVFGDRAGRLWRIAEVCARCAAATQGCRVLDTAAPPPSAAPSAPALAAAGERGREPVVALFSDGGAPADGPGAPPAPFPQPRPVPKPGAGGRTAPVPGARAGSPRAAAQRSRQWGKIAQRIVPYDLQPDVLRLELIELGDAFRAYQRDPEPDLALLAGLHDRKARAFALWADVTGDHTLREEAERAEKAARAAREMNENRVGVPAGEGGPAVERLLSRAQAVHARTVLAHVRDRAPHPEPEVRLAVFMLTLRAARAGLGNVTGQDFTGWLQGDAEWVLQRLVDSGWMRLPDTVTVADALVARSEDPAQITVPTLLPTAPRPFSFGKVSRARLSGWAQKVVGDRKLRKKKAGAAPRLLALYTAAHIRPDGRLGGAEDDGLDLSEAARFCGVPPEETGPHLERLLAADWLTEGETAPDANRLRGQLSPRVLSLGALL